LNFFSKVQGSYRAVYESSLPSPHKACLHNIMFLISTSASEQENPSKKVRNQNKKREKSPQQLITTDKKRRRQGWTRASTSTPKPLFFLRHFPYFQWSQPANYEKHHVLKKEKRREKKACSARYTNLLSCHRRVSDQSPHPMLQTHQPLADE